MAGYSWKWYTYPHGNRELVEEHTDASLEQISPDEQDSARFVLTRKGEGQKREHWLIVLDDKRGHDTWLEALFARANEILDNPEEFPQVDF